MFEYSDEYIEQLIRGIFQGDITLLNLPQDYYKAVTDYLERGVNKGFGASLDNIKFGTPDYELLSELRRNVYYFSGAKTFQQTFQMSELLIGPDGHVRDWNAFRKEAREIFSTFNEGYLKTEHTTAIIQAGNARKWQDVQENKHLMPYLRRVAVGDEMTCAICGRLHGITAHVDDPIWNRVAGAAHFNCRCIEEQITREEGQGKAWEEKAMDQAVVDSNMPEEFQFNPGKLKEVFATEGKPQHPYFQVPKQYIKFAQDNFNLPLPS